jgi:tetratricopeptide (TPR) repeat protein
VHYLAGRYAEGLADTDRAVAIDPKLTAAWSRRGVLHERLGERQQAFTDFERALALDANYSEAIDGLKRLGASH